MPALPVLGHRHDPQRAISKAEKVEFETMPWLETFLVASIDVALAAQNAVVAAESIGLSTVYIGAMRNEPEQVAELLGLPKQCFVLFGLCVGYATEQAAGEVKPRMPQAMMLHHERYDASNADAQRETHDAEMMRFSARHELQAGTWTQRVLNRLGPIKSMNGRERLRDALNRWDSGSANAGNPRGPRGRLNPESRFRRLTSTAAISVWKRTLKHDLVFLEDCGPLPARSPPWSERP